MTFLQTVYVCFVVVMVAVLGIAVACRSWRRSKRGSRRAKVRSQMLKTEQRMKVAADPQKVVDLGRPSIDFNPELYQ